MTKLVKAPPGHRLEGLGGFIPPNTVCPFLQKCHGTCPAGHKGTEHEVYFSCALARGWDLIEHPNRLEEGQ